MSWKWKKTGADYVGQGGKVLPSIKKKKAGAGFLTTAKKKTTEL